jgi:hypothetical protein
MPERTPMIPANPRLGAWNHYQTAQRAPTTVEQPRRSLTSIWHLSHPSPTTVAIIIGMVGLTLLMRHDRRPQPIQNHTMSITPAIASQAAVGTGKSEGQLALNVDLPISTPEDVRRRQVRATIEQANQAFVRARSLADSAPLQTIAAESWLAYEQAQIDLLRQSALTQHWQALNIDILSIAIAHDRASVCTIEAWQLMPIEADGNAGPARTQHWFERYSLIASKTGWRVSAIEYLPDPCSAG